MNRSEVQVQVQLTGNCIAEQDDADEKNDTHLVHWCSAVQLQWLDRYRIRAVWCVHYEQDFALRLVHSDRERCS